MNAADCALVAGCITGLKSIFFFLKIFVPSANLPIQDLKYLASGKRLVFKPHRRHILNFRSVMADLPKVRWIRK